MKDKILKIFVLLILILPMWITLIYGDEANDWKDLANRELLKIDEPRVQLAKVTSASEPFDATLKNYSIKLDTSSIRERGTSSLMIRFEDENGQLARHVTLEADAIVQKKVAIANKTLKRGDVLQASDVRWEWREAKNVPNSAIQSDAPIGQAVRSTMQQGFPLDANRFEAATVIKRGSRVNIKVVGHGITISGQGVAQESGKVGQNIRVLNTDSKKEIMGTVIAGEIVEVRI